jgi:hypothetical protein
VPRACPWVSTKRTENPLHIVDDEFQLSEDERLMSFTERAGIDLKDLTTSDCRRILYLLEGLESGYEFASKRGVPISALYGDRANSEKVKRQRLFKKIRDKYKKNLA